MWDFRLERLVLLRGPVGVVLGRPAAIRLGRRLRAGRNVSALSALIRVAGERAPAPASASASAYRILDAACEDPAFLLRLVNRLNGRLGEMFVGQATWDNVFVPLLLQSGPPATYLPSIRLIWVLQAGPELLAKLGLRDEMNAYSLQELKKVALTMLFHPFEPYQDVDDRRSAVGSMLRTTNHPDLLRALTDIWLGKDDRDYIRDSLTDIVAANPYLSQGIGDEVLLAVLKDRTDLIDRDAADTVDILLRGLRIPGLAEGSRQVLRTLPAGRARERLCNLATYRPEARRIVIENDWAPTRLLDRVRFYFLTEQWERYLQLDPDGRRIREVYRSPIGPFEPQAIRRMITRLAGEQGVRRMRLQFGRTGRGPEMEVDFVGADVTGTADGALSGIADGFLSVYDFDFRSDSEYGRKSEAESGWDGAGSGGDSGRDD